MTRALKQLDSIQIATPCKADWNQMTGDERVRFCGMCRLNVYNLSGMPRAEAEALVQKSEGKVCVRFFKREDGTVLTQDCPIGLKVVRKMRRAVAFVAASFAALVGLGGLFARTSSGSSDDSIITLPWRRPQPPRMLMGTMCPPRTAPSPSPQPRVMMGEVSVAPVATMGKVRAPEPKAPPTPDAPSGD